MPHSQPSEDQSDSHCTVISVHVRHDTFHKGFRQGSNAKNIAQARDAIVASVTQRSAFPVVAIGDFNGQLDRKRMVDVVVPNAPADLTDEEVPSGDAVAKPADVTCSLLQAAPSRSVVIECPI